MDPYSLHLTNIYFDFWIWDVRIKERSFLKEEVSLCLSSEDPHRISALSVLEVQLGVKKGEEEKTDRFLKSLRIFDVNMEIANHAAGLIREYRTKGVTVDLPDAIIASTCILHDLILVTYNTKHYPVRELKFHPLPQTNP